MTTRWRSSGANSRATCGWPRWRGESALRAVRSSGRSPSTATSHSARSFAPRGSTWPRGCSEVPTSRSERSLVGLGTATTRRSPRRFGASTGCLRAPTRRAAGRLAAMDKDRQSPRSGSRTGALPWAGQLGGAAGVPPRPPLLTSRFVSGRLAGCWIAGGPPAEPRARRDVRGDRRVPAGEQVGVGEEVGRHVALPGSSVSPARSKSPQARARWLVSCSSWTAFSASSV
jgi:hypothetical protein